MKIFSNCIKKKRNWVPYFRRLLEITTDNKSGFSLQKLGQNMFFLAFFSKMEQYVPQEN